MKVLPPHIFPRYDHPTYSRLQEVFGPAIELMWNSRLSRYEVWAFGLFHERVVAPGGVGFAQPGEWLVERMRREDPAHNDIDTIVREKMAALDAENAAKKKESEDRDHALAAEIAGTYAPIFEREMRDDPIIAKPFTTGEKKEAA